ncbi:MAG: alpha/beta hydrolase [Anaerolineales bacterium]
MKKSSSSAGYFRSGLAYNRFGHGARPLVIFQGLEFENKPLVGLSLPLFSIVYKFLFFDKDYTTYIVNRKPGLPDGYTLKEMSDDYATMIKEEFGGPVDIIGVSTGGAIAQHFAADHPDLILKLVIHSSAYTLSAAGMREELQIGHLARQHQWREAYTILVSPMFPQNGIMKYVSAPLVWLASRMGGMLFGAPEDLSDLVITVKAEEKHNFKDRLNQISAPTLVIAGDKDPFYTEALFRATAEDIPNARLILYKGMGHPAYGKQFHRDVLLFLKD